MGANNKNNFNAKDAIPEDANNINNPSLAKDAFSAISNDTASKFVTCHRYTSSTVTTSSPAHWHKEIEIMHFLAGKEFVHTCQCHGETFDAPAIVIVPSNLIHRTRYSPNCKVNRVLFNSEHVRLHENDKALEQALSFLRGGDGRGSIVIQENDPGFQKLNEILCIIENLSDPSEDNTFDPTKAQEVSIQQDRMDAFVSANFANIGNAEAQASQMESLNQYQRQQEEKARISSLFDEEKGHSNSGDAFAFSADKEPEEHSLQSQFQYLFNNGASHTEKSRKSNCQYMPSHPDSFIGEEIVADEAVVSSLGQPDPANSAPVRRASAINAGSIAIALAHNFEDQGIDGMNLVGSYNRPCYENAGFSRLNHRELLNCHMMGLTLQFKAHLLSLLGALFEFGYLMETRTMRRPRLARYSDDRIKMLLKYIHDNYNHSMNISELAKMLQVTNQYFCRYFKQLTDMSFIDYLNDLRLQKAAVEIATTQQSIREISARHGFDTIGYFFKLFRERYHMTPVNYRNHILEKCKSAELEYLSSRDYLNSPKSELRAVAASAAKAAEQKNRLRAEQQAEKNKIRMSKRRKLTDEAADEALDQFIKDSANNIKID